MVKRNAGLVYAILIFLCTSGCLALQPYNEITPYRSRPASEKIRATLLLSQTNRLKVLELPAIDLTGRHRYTYKNSVLTGQFQTIDIRSILTEGLRASLLSRSKAIDVEVVDNGLSGVRLRRKTDSDDFFNDMKESYYDFTGNEEAIKNPYVLEVTVYNWGMAYGLIYQGMFEQPFIHVIVTLHDVNKGEILYKAVLNDTKKGNTVEYYMLGSPFVRNLPHYPLRAKEIFDTIALKLDTSSKEYINRTKED